MKNRVATSNTPILAILGAILAAGLMGTSLVSYYISRDSIRENIIGTELPLTSDTIYSEIEKDLVRPTLMSSMMSHDAFLLDWVEHGENDVPLMQSFLEQMMRRNDVFTSFFVSQKTGKYYHTSGVVRTITKADGRDAWFYEDRDSGLPYKIDIDQDTANHDRLTIFINARVENSKGEFLGFTGLGLTVDSVAKLIAHYQEQYQRTVFFVDKQRKITMSSAQNGPAKSTLLDDFAQMKELTAGLPELTDATYEYTDRGDRHFVNVRYVAELHWYLFVDKVEDAALYGIRKVLMLNLAVSVVVMLIVLSIVGWALRRFQARIEALAQVDTLTDLPTRRSFITQAAASISQARATGEAMAAVVVDLDFFKQLNDTFGHAAGDYVLRLFSATLRNTLGDTGFACRWGGDEFVALLRRTSPAQAERIVEKIRTAVADQAYRFTEETMHVTVSQGITNLRPDDDLDALVNRADRALYAAKHSGRNRIVTDFAN